MRNRRIEICGGIASGKTSLAQVLEQEGFVALYERFEDNPFLNVFYTDEEAENTFETEIVFVLLHYNLIKRNRKKAMVCDYSLLQDYCYGINNLKEAEKALFDKLFFYLNNQVSEPEFIIYLKCNVSCLLERIKKRGRSMEDYISAEYLQSNIDILEAYLSKQENVLVIESDKYNFLEKDREVVVRRVMEYYNGKRECCNITEQDIGRI